MSMALVVLSFSLLLCNWLLKKCKLCLSSHTWKFLSYLVIIRCHENKYKLMDKKTAYTWRPTKRDQEKKSLRKKENYRVIFKCSSSGVSTLYYDSIIFYSMDIRRKNYIVRMPSSVSCWNFLVKEWGYLYWGFSISEEITLKIYFSLFEMCRII